MERAEKADPEAIVKAVEREPFCLADSRGMEDHAP